MGTVTINTEAIALINVIATIAGDSPGAACISATDYPIYYPDGYTFATTPVMWEDVSGTIFPPDAYYSAEGVTRYWTGTAFGPNTITCGVQIYLHTSFPDAMYACIAEGYDYFIDSDDFATATTVYTDYTMSEVATPQPLYFSDGFISRLLSGNILGTALPCIPFTEIVLRYGTTTAGICNTAASGPFYIEDGETFATTSVLYKNQSLSIPADQNYYSDGSIYRYWNGTAFTGATVTCTSYNEYLLGYLQDFNAGGACGETLQYPTYIDEYHDFENAVEIWSTSTGTLAPSAGWYSDGIVSRYWDGSVFTSTVTCPVLPPTTFRTSQTVSACGVNTYIDLYMSPTGTFENATALYSDQYGTTFAPSGYYSREDISRFWDGTVFTGATQTCVVSYKSTGTEWSLPSVSPDCSQIDYQTDRWTATPVPQIGDYFYDDPLLTIVSLQPDTCCLSNTILLTGLWYEIGANTGQIVNIGSCS